MSNKEFLESISEEGEIWKPVVGYEGLYVVSNHGRVAALARTFVRKNGSPYTKSPNLLTLNKCDNKTGHLAVSLYRDGEKPRCYVHRLVAMAFLPNPCNYPIVEHIDCVATNNNASNLRWCTQSDNMSNPITSRLRTGVKHNLISPYRKSVAQIKDDKIIAVYDYISKTKEFGFTESCVIRCCKGQIKTHRGFQWKYLADLNLNINNVKELLK